MFQTDEQWEEVRYTPSLRELLQQPGLRRYPIIELTTDASIFFLDAMSEVEAPEAVAWSRYICATLATVVELLGRNPRADVRLHVHTFNKRSQEYATHRVTEILLTLDEQNNHLLLYRRDDDQLCVDGTDNLYEISETRTSTLWTANKKPE